MNFHVFGNFLLLLILIAHRVCVEGFSVLFIFKGSFSYVCSTVVDSSVALPNGAGDLDSELDGA